MAVFPTDIKRCMRDCLLSLFWAKKDIVGFFQQHSCTKDDLKPVEKYEVNALSRVAIVDAVFESLAARVDGGLGQFRSMLQALVNWSQFDPYYFEKLKKLNRGEAQRNIDHLKQLVEIRDAKIHKEREAREDAEKNRQTPTDTLSGLRDRFLALHGGSLPPQERGYALEKILLELSKLCNLEITEPFKVAGEQIDGSIKYDGEHYLIEAKWHNNYSSNEPLYQFAGKIEGKMYGRGIFLSIQGFSNDVVRSLITGKVVKTILVDGADLVLVLEQHLTFDGMINSKVKAAQTRGLIYVDPITGKPKVS